jgi:two-component system OmpR family response regulator
MRILVVEDQPDMADALRQGLEEEGHAVIASADGRDALTVAGHYELDAVVLDMMLPGLDGCCVARRLRESGALMPILMLTARDAIPDIVRGLDSGADDYLTKPFAFEVLLARLRALGRRGDVEKRTVYEVADLQLDPSTRQVHRGGYSIALTRTEYLLLELLASRAGRVVTRQMILDSVWGFGQDVESNTVDAFVRLLRHKIDQPGQLKLIHTIRGVGFRLSECDRA